MDKYAILGNPITHTLSPIIHAEFATQTNQSIEYHKIQPPKDEFKQALFEFIEAGGKGCNITTPFKQQAFQLSYAQSHSATEALAASCLLIRDDNTIYADNYDGTGFIKDLTHNHGVSIHQKNILILGAGGATQGIVNALLDRAPAHIIIANRTEKTAIELAKRYPVGGLITGVSFAALDPTPYDLIIHATTLGHTGNRPDLPDGLITPHTFCYDLSYGKAAQPFLEWAAQQGAKQYADGLGMLVEHNAALFYLWRHVSPNTKPVIELLRKEV